MKIDVPIEINGITQVVVDRCQVWTKSIILDEWALKGSNRIKSPHQMSTYIRSKLRNPNRRGWCKGETLNIGWK